MCSQPLLSIRFGRVEIELNIPEKMLPFWTEQCRHKVAHGGRGGAKSHSIARMLLAKGRVKPIRWLCTREVQKSIKDSVHKLLADRIDEMGLGGFYDVQRDTIKGRNGTEFLFAGLKEHTIDSIKSFEGCDGVWIEEAHSVSQRSAQVLVPTIRKPGSELWWSYNPDQEDDYVHNRFVINKDPQSIVVEINWRDNPWFPAELEYERQQLKAINEDLYNHVWEGKCRSIGGLLFKRHWFKWYDRLPERLNLYMASDYAVTDEAEADRSPDWTEHGIWGMADNGDLYAVDWWSGQTAPDAWISAAMTLIRRHRPLKWFEEKGVILRAVDSSITKAMREQNAFICREPMASAGNKAARALGFAARASSGAVWLPKNQDWANRLINQLCAFNGEDGRTDDMVDVCSILGRSLDSMANAVAANAQKRQNTDRWDKAFAETRKSSWKTV